VPRKPTIVDAVNIRQFEQNLSNYFHKMQGRGENCKVDCYKRNDLDYFFAYPEDYAQANVEWAGKEFKRARITPPSRSSSFTRRMMGRWICFSARNLPQLRSARHCMHRPSR
jgi:hypothetical protein